MERVWWLILDRNGVTTNESRRADDAFPNSRNPPFLSVPSPSGGTGLCFQLL